VATKPASGQSADLDDLVKYRVLQSDRVVENAEFVGPSESRKTKLSPRGAEHYPTTIRVDQGSEFVSRDLDLWAYTRGVTLDFSRPGTPTDNAVIGAFNGRFRAECLNAHWFMSLEDARQKMEAWRRYYDEERPHGAIGQKVPITLLARDGTASPPS
jgi:transposase InsO family protein